MNAPRRRRHIAEGVDVRHHVVAEASLVRRDGIEVDVVEMRAHLRERLVGNRHAELLLRLRRARARVGATGRVALPATTARASPCDAYRSASGDEYRSCDVIGRRTSVTKQLALALDDDAEVRATAVLRRSRARRPARSECDDLLI